MTSENVTEAERNAGSDGTEKSTSDGIPLLFQRRSGRTEWPLTRRGTVHSTDNTSDRPDTYHNSPKRQRVLH